ncbi:MAG: hypothetical protein ABSH39_11695 [Candidatus Acidiferrum sp.]|jgi:hypothetical protein
MRTMISVRSFLLALMMLAFSAASFAQVRISVTIAPPELPVYEQPICPGDGYIWTPGYWAWDDDYYWVPGTWVEAPEVGFFWTPAYWGWEGSSFVFYDGYWGPTIGFYGGINYGFGYFGHGFDGGRWDHGHFFYNRAVANINVNIIHNVYDTKVENVTETRVSFNGGNGGINARPTAQEQAAANERHIPPVAAQTEHIQAARSNQQLRASVNHGKPPIAATPKPGAFTDHAAVAAKEGTPYNATANREANGNGNGAARTADNGAARPATPIHPKDLPPAERPAAPNTGNPDLDKKYQKQQDKLQQKQDQERQKLQQKQDRDHARQAKNADDKAQQQLEQKHQQQTQQLQQKHTQQQQQLQQRQAPPAAAPRPAAPARPH